MNIVSGAAVEAAKACFITTLEVAVEDSSSTILCKPAFNLAPKDK